MTKKHKPAAGFGTYRAPCSAIRSKFADDWPPAPYGYKWSGTSWVPRKTKKRKPNAEAHASATKEPIA